MTPAQIIRIQTKIKKYRAALTAERTRFGWYDDSGGRRYKILELFISIDDYKGALVYLRWFFKNFPDDAGFPFFWVESYLTYFHNNKLAEARTMAFNAFMANPNIWEVFFTSTATEINGFKPSSNWEGLSLALELPYRATQEKYFEFANWLQTILSEPSMQNLIMQYFGLTLKLSISPVGPERTKLVRKLSALRV